MDVMRLLMVGNLSVKTLDALSVSYSTEALSPQAQELHLPACPSQRTNKPSRVFLISISTCSTWIFEMLWAILTLSKVEISFNYF